LVLSAALLLLVTAFAAADKYAAPSAGSLSDELQWLAIQTACIGQYSMAQTGDFTLGDPPRIFISPATSAIAGFTRALKINPNDAFVKDFLEDARRGR
jgi:hypothetical protein